MAGATINQLTTFVTYSTASAGLACLVVGLAMTAVDYRHKYDIRVKTAEVLDAAKPKFADGSLQEQGGLSDTLNSVANIATSLKDLDSGFRMLVLSIAFLAVAALAAGVDSIAAAVAK